MHSFFSLRKFHVLLLLLALTTPSSTSAIDGSGIVFVDPVLANGSDIFETIQEAIDAACDGDEILVEPGTYKEILTITNKSLTISVDTPPNSGERVTIDACFTSSVLLNSNDGMPKQVVFEGFEFINGSIGGLELFNADICLVDVIINGNFSPFSGGAIFQLGGIINVEGGSIANNISMSDGGGIFVSENGVQTYNNVDISNNSCTGSGAAICAVNSGTEGSVTANDSTIDNNIAMENDGGGILGIGVDINLNNVHLGGNQCPGVGAGAAFANCNVCNINDCTIKNNSCNGAGGGLFCQDSNVCIIQSILCNNESVDASGGGIYCIGGNFDCNANNINNNFAGMNGGGVQLVELEEGNQVILNSCIEDNVAELNGGGLALFGPSGLVELIKSKVSKNCANANGGGVLVDNGSLKAANSRFMSNKATENGGGILGSSGSTVKCNGCIIDGNWANTGGGMFNSDSFFDVHNVNIIFNVADALAGAIAATVKAEMNGVNSIVTSNGVNDPIFESTPNTININFSVVEGGYPGTGNLNIDPNFVDELGTDGMPGTGDEDFCLNADSGAIDAGNNADVPEDIHDLDWDGDFTELTPIDYKGNDRFVNGSDSGGSFNFGVEIVDMGAIEFQGDVVDVLLGDVNLDGVVDLLDVQPFVTRLTDGEFQAEADVNQDGILNLLDVQPFVSLLAN